MSAWIKVLAVLLLVTAAYVAGRYQERQAIDAAGARTAKAEVAAQATDFQHQITQHTAELDKQQADSSALMAHQKLIRDGGVDLRLEIEHAQFTPEPLGIATSCPDPSGTAEFERLYNAAAEGKDARDSTDAGTGRVPEVGIRVVRPEP